MEDHVRAARAVFKRARRERRCFLRNPFSSARALPCLHCIGAARLRRRACHGDTWAYLASCVACASSAASVSMTCLFWLGRQAGGGAVLGRRAAFCARGGGARGARPRQAQPAYPGCAPAFPPPPSCASACPSQGPCSLSAACMLGLCRRGRHMRLSPELHRCTSAYKERNRCKRSACMHGRRAGRGGRRQDAGVGGAGRPAGCGGTAEGDGAAAAAVPGPV